MASIAGRMKSKVTSFTPSAVEQLLRYPWPGNVRELENAIERAVVLASGTRIDAGDLPSEVGGAAATSYFPGDERSLAEVEQAYILAVLAAHGGHRGKAASHLKIGAATLYRKLAAYGVT